MTCVQSNLGSALLVFSTIVGLTAHVGFVTACAQEESADDAKKEARFEYMIKATGRFEARVGESDQKARLDEKALLRWTAPAEKVVDGLLLLYTQGPGTRPAVVSDYHVHSNGFEVQEFVAIAPDLEMNDGTVDFWKPVTRHGEIKVLPAGPAPAKSAVLRLVQMKDLAKRFEVTTDAGTKDPERYALRMMPRPLYRYGLPDSEITDGAVFMWSRGTDPDAILIIELHSADEKFEWHYGIFPVSIHALDATLDGETVWTKPKIRAYNDGSGAHFAGPYRRSADDPPIGSLLP